MKYTDFADKGLVFEKQANGKWRWRVTHRNGNQVGQSSEGGGYSSRAKAVQGFKAMLTTLRDAGLIDIKEL